MHSNIRHDELHYLPMIYVQDDMTLLPPSSVSLSLTLITIYPTPSLVCLLELELFVRAPNTEL